MVWGFICPLKTYSRSLVNSDLKTRQDTGETKSLDFNSAIKIYSKTNVPVYTKLKPVCIYSVFY